MRSAGLALIGVIVLVVLFMIVKPPVSTSPQTAASPKAVSSPSSSSAASSKVATTPTATTSQSEAPSPALSNTSTFNLSVKNKKLVAGSAVLTVKQGDTVAISITNDDNEELHLHGYNKRVSLVKDSPATLTFVADKTGHFEYELEESGTRLGAVDVLP